MIDESKQIYVKHNFSTTKNAFEEIQKSTSKKERIYMVKMLKPSIDYLQKCGIKEYQNFIETLKKYNFKLNDIKDFILEFQMFINSNDQHQKMPQIDWIRHRELNKANFGEKNIILNRLSYDYPNQLLYFLQIFLLRKFPHIANRNIFYNEFLFKVQKINSSKLLKK